MTSTILRSGTCAKQLAGIVTSDTLSSPSPAQLLDNH
jgi:hypothetical protein